MMIAQERWYIKDNDIWVWPKKYLFIHVCCTVAASMRSGLRKIYLLNKTVDRNTNYYAFGSIIPAKKCFYFSRMFALPCYWAAVIIEDGGQQQNKNFLVVGLHMNNRISPLEVCLHSLLTCWYMMKLKWKTQCGYATWMVWSRVERNLIILFSCYHTMPRMHVSISGSENAFMCTLDDGKLRILYSMYWKQEINNWIGFLHPKG